jgi:hypothetical protein
MKSNGDDLRKKGSFGRNLRQDRKVFLVGLRAAAFCIIPSGCSARSRV